MPLAYGRSFLASTVAGVRQLRGGRPEKLPCGAKATARRAVGERRCWADDARARFIGVRAMGPPSEKATARSFGARNLYTGSGRLAAP